MNEHTHTPPSEIHYNFSFPRERLNERNEGGAISGEESFESFPIWRHQANLESLTSRNEDLAAPVVTVFGVISGGIKGARAVFH